MMTTLDHGTATEFASQSRLSPQKSRLDKYCAEFSVFGRLKLLLRPAGKIPPWESIAPITCRSEPGWGWYSLQTGRSFSLTSHSSQFLSCIPQNMSSVAVWCTCVVLCRHGPVWDVMVTLNQTATVLWYWGCSFKCVILKSTKHWTQ